MYEYSHKSEFFRILLEYREPCISVEFAYVQNNLWFLKLIL